MPQHIKLVEVLLGTCPALLLAGGQNASAHEVSQDTVSHRS